MKKYLFFVLLTITLVGQSCLDITEEFWFNKDKSGKYSLTLDMAKMAMAADMLAAMAPPNDSVETADNFKKAVMDTVIYLRDLPDSAKTKLLYPELLDRTVLKVNMNMPEKKAAFSLEFEFKNPQELTSFRQMFGALKNSSQEGGIGEKAGLLTALFAQNGGQTYNFESRTFSRTCLPLDLDNPDSPMQEALQSFDNPFAQMMFGDAKYRVVMHFPSKVKKVKGEGYTKNGNTVSLELPWTDAIMHPEKLSCTVKVRK